MQSSPLFQDVKTFFRDFFQNPPESVCVAASGGADSTALFFLLSALREELGIKRLGIAHVNHGLRGMESDADAEFVKAMAKRADVPFHGITLSPRQEKAGMEAWARSSRYGFFKQLIAAQGYDFVATGHTADDQAETVLMRLMRGCGLKGLCGIEPLRRDGVIRPLLYIKRSRLRAWLAATNRTFREDCSNRILDYTRNRVRSRLLPSLEAARPGTTDVLLRIASSARQTWSLLEPRINKWIAAYVVQKGADAFAIKKTGFSRKLDAEEAVAHALRERGIDFQRCHIESLTASVGKINATVLLGGGWRCRSGRVFLIFSKGRVQKEDKKEDATAFCVPIAMPGKTEDGRRGVVFTAEHAPRAKGSDPPFSKDNLTVFLDARKTGKALEFRSITPADAFVPLGSRQKRNVRAYVKKQKKTEIARGLVAQRDGEVLWIPGVQIGDGVRVTPQTRSMVKISYTSIR